MKFKIYNWFGSFAVFMAVAVLTGCSNNGGTALVVDPEAPASVVATSSKDVALADGADSVAINAMVTKLDGTAVADGTEVTFTIDDPDGSLSAASATTTGGVATVNLTHAPIVTGNNQTTTVTCTAGLVSGNVSVEFVNDPEAPASVVVTSSKDVALADGADSAAISAMVTKVDGTAVADGTEVTFTITDPDGSLSAASATTTGGVATVNLTHAPIVTGNNQTTMVTCTAGMVSGNVSVKFINQPASVDVFIGFDQAVTDLAALQFVLNNTAGATFDNGAQLIAAINAAAGSLVAANFDVATNTNAIALVNPSGFNTGIEPIIRATYAVSAGLPTFSVASPPATFIATDPGNGPTDPVVTAANMVISLTYDTEL